jgi:hypothetical protein
MCESYHFCFQIENTLSSVGLRGQIERLLILVIERLDPLILVKLGRIDGNMTQSELILDLFNQVVRCLMHAVLNKGEEVIDVSVLFHQLKQVILNLQVRVTKQIGEHFDGFVG